MCRCSSLAGRSRSSPRWALADDLRRCPLDVRKRRTPPSGAAVWLGGDRHASANLLTWDHPRGRVSFPGGHGRGALLDDFIKVGSSAASVSEQGQTGWADRCQPHVRSWHSTLGRRAAAVSHRLPVLTSPGVALACRQALIWFMVSGTRRHESSTDSTGCSPAVPRWSSPCTPHGSGRTPTRVDPPARLTACATRWLPPGRGYGRGRPDRRLLRSLVERISGQDHQGPVLALGAAMGVDC